MTENERLRALLNANADTLQRFDAVLTGGPDPLPCCKLLPIGRAADELGVSRATLWRLCKAGKLGRVELRPGSYRIPQAELLRFAGGKA